MTVCLLLRAKAEVALGALLVVRNRTVRLACVLSLVMVCLSLMDSLGQTPSVDRQTTIFLIAGTLSAVAGSRLLAPGGATAASRQVAARFWLVPLGRLIGAVFVVIPAVGISALSLLSGDIDPVQFGLAALIYVAAAAAAALVLAPVVGGSAAAVAGSIAVWVGVVSPSEIKIMFSNWPVCQRVLVVIWHLLPLQWRADRLVDELNWTDPLVLLAWVLFGVALAGWATIPVRSIRRCRRGDEWQR